MYIFILCVLNNIFSYYSHVIITIQKSRMVRIFCKKCGLEFLKNTYACILYLTLPQINISHLAKKWPSSYREWWGKHTNFIGMSFWTPKDLLKRWGGFASFLNWYTHHQILIIKYDHLAANDELCIYKETLLEANTTMRSRHQNGQRYLCTTLKQEANTACTWY